ncbi:MAG: hypothetical protein AAB521_01955 [Patescibacteria group bacterium]
MTVESPILVSVPDGSRNGSISSQETKQPQPNPLDSIFELVAIHLKLQSPADIQNPDIKPTPEIKAAKYLSSYLLERAGVPTEDVAHLFRSDLNSVNRGINKIEHLMHDNPNTARKIDKIENKIPSINGVDTIKHDVLDTVPPILNVDLKFIKKNVREEYTSNVRHLLVYLVRTSGSSLKESGSSVNRSHAAAINSIRRVLRRMREDNDFRDFVTELEDMYPIIKARRDLREAVRERVVQMTSSNGH